MDPITWFIFSRRAQTLSKTPARVKSSGLSLLLGFSASRALNASVRGRYLRVCPCRGAGASQARVPTRFQLRRYLAEPELSTGLLWSSQTASHFVLVPRPRPRTRPRASMRREAQISPASNHPRTRPRAPAGCPRSARPECGSRTAPPVGPPAAPPGLVATRRPSPFVRSDGTTPPSGGDR